MISKLPVEILLEIFDFYRQSFEVERQLNYERDWNNKNGWFKLAHVCRHWRSVVLTFSSRLQLRLYFTVHTPTGAAALTALSTLPIVIDYLNVPRTVAIKNRLTSTPGYPNRVCKIAFTVSYTNRDMIPKALDFTFPMLESLELHHPGLPGFYFPSTFLTTSSKSLRQLKIFNGTLASLTPLLSVTTALVDLTLRVDRISASRVSLLPLLQCLPFLRRLDVSVTSVFPPIHATPDSVSLAQLTYLRLKGSPAPVEQLISGLAIPSLQNLHVSLNCRHSAFHIPHLSKLIHNAGILYVAAQISLSQSTFILSLPTHPHLIDDTPFNIMAEKQSSIAEISSELSELLATVEDVTVAFLLPTTYRSDPVNLALWRGFFEQLQNVKMLRLQYGLEIQVADILRQDDTQPTMNLFPSLEGIEVYQRYLYHVPIPDSGRTSVLGPFEALVSTRQRAGRPVKVYWHRDQVLPTPFYRIRYSSNWEDVSIF
jgi:hypothetical protein